MSKYDPLHDYLLSLKREEWRAAFDQIEEILGFPLPRSAFEYQAWWANERSEKRDHKQAWLGAGWRTVNLNLTGRTVEFVRDSSQQRTPKKRAAAVLPEPSSPPAPYKQIGPVHVVDLLSSLAERRPIFHSEADFQHALAWAIHERYADANIRLEYKPFPKERLYVDIWVSGTENAAIELKYLTRGLEVDLDGEGFSLKNQAAQDIRQYDVLKDIVRLERIVSEMPGTAGYAVVLTNDSAYWKSPTRADTIDAAFRIHEGRTIDGTLRWSESAGHGSIKGRETPLTLANSYHIAWRDYSALPVSSYGQMRYLLIEVPPV